MAARFGDGIAEQPHDGVDRICDGIRGGCGEHFAFVFLAAQRGKLERGRAGGVRQRRAAQQERNRFHGENATKLARICRSKALNGRARAASNTGLLASSRYAL